MKKTFLYLIFLVFLCISCQDKMEEQVGDKIEIRLINQADFTIDSLIFDVITSNGTTSLLFNHIYANEMSDYVQMDDCKYYFIQEGDIFIISEGKFVIEGQEYFLSNCFCDPDLKEEVLAKGKYAIIVDEIDPLRNIVNYIIEREE